MDKKVSVITPCYNGESFIERFLKTILDQSYNNIELIIIDDGSKDNTAQIINSYKEQYKRRGYNLIYIYQENGGQASALNKGLKVFSGYYLTWPDSDDFLHKDSIKNRVEFLERNPQYALVRSSAYMYDENNLNNVIGYLGKEINPLEDIFKALITEEVGCTPGRYMVKTTAFLDCIPNRQIYESRAGQNWQMLLPIAYKYKCGYIDEELFNYVVRRDSHSHSDENISEEVTLRKLSGHEDILFNTIERVIINNDVEREEYKNLIEEKYARLRLKIASNYRNKVLLDKNYKILMSKNKISYKDRFIYLKGKSKFLSSIFSLKVIFFHKYN
ncbi:glycosyltransferase family 2 protein [Clostridium perfringens]|nr:glycosyltransferase family 2 protein [Clostridium perfringens]MDM0449400.1 glycosyltransferase family 2 protein [Clostridium perfringens]